MIAGHEIALAILAVLGTPPPDVVDAAAAAGFDSITLRILDGTDESPLIGDTPTRRETIARLRHHGLGVLDVEVVRLRPDTEPAALRPALEAAAALGARHVLVVNQDPDDERAAEHFAGICAEAEPYEVRPVLEFMVFTATKRVADADGIVRRAGHPAGGVLVDSLHLQRSGGTPADVADLAKANPDRYPYAQLCDAPEAAPEGGGRALYEEAVENRLAPGEGELPLEELVRALPPNTALSVETPVAAIAHLAAPERAERIMAATRRVLTDE
jgi:sugar phosphate isomerase/epimerase